MAAGASLKPGLRQGDVQSFGDYLWCTWYPGRLVEMAYYETGLLAHYTVKTSSTKRIKLEASEDVVNVARAQHRNENLVKGPGFLSMFGVAILIER